VEGGDADDDEAEEEDVNYVTVYKHFDGTAQLDHPTGPSCIIAIANAIKNMSLLQSVNLLHNNISVEQAQSFVTLLKEHPTLKSLCGNSGNEKELDLSHKNIGVDGAIMLSSEISENQALVKLTFGDTQAVTMTTGMAKANFGDKLKSYEGRIVAAFLPKCL
jgi:hypothetical protein